MIKIKKLTQEELIEGMVSWSGGSISYCNFIINQTNIKNLNDIEALFNKYNFSSESIIGSKRVYKDLKVETNSNILMLNNEKLNLKDNEYFIFDGILGLINSNFLKAYYKKNK